MKVPPVLPPRIRKEQVKVGQRQTKHLELFPEVGFLIDTINATPEDRSPADLASAARQTNITLRTVNNRFTPKSLIKMAQTPSRAPRATSVLLGINQIRISYT